jgi:hypothetical protein
MWFATPALLAGSNNPSRQQEDGHSSAAGVAGADQTNAGQPAATASASNAQPSANRQQQQQQQGQEAPASAAAARSSSRSGLRAAAGSMTADDIPLAEAAAAEAARKRCVDFDFFVFDSSRPVAQLAHLANVLAVKGTPFKYMREWLYMHCDLKSPLACSRWGAWYVSGAGYRC